MSSGRSPTRTADPELSPGPNAEAAPINRLPKRNFRLLLEYDGTHYHGWQRQQGVMTIQEMLESKLAIMLDAGVRVRASGRTDAGVHARGQVVNFYARSRLQPGEFQHGLNALLPPDIVVRRADEVPEAFHARFSARMKTYEYRILNRPVRSAMERNACWHIRRPLQIEAMRQALDVILGEHDFAAFMAAGSMVKSTVRIVSSASIQWTAGEVILFRFAANGFLRHMVRNLVGTLVEVGRGKLRREHLAAILESGDRRRAGMTAPARGLFLDHVDYD